MTDIDPVDQQNGLFEAAIEQTADAVYITDVDGRIEYVNSAFEEITGYEREEAIGKTPRILNSGAHDASFYQDLWQTILTPEQWETEIIDETKHGEKIILDQTISPITTPDGKIEKFVAVARDITDRKERESELRTKTRALDGAPVGISIFDADRDGNPLVYVNDQFTEITGYSKAEAISRDCLFLQGEGTDSDRIATIRDAIEDDRAVSTEIRNYRKDGSEFWNSLHLSPVERPDGTVEQFVAFHRDITDRKQRERELELLKQIQSRLLRHNLRNQLQIVTSYAECCSMRPTECSEEGEQILSAIEELERLSEKTKSIESLLDRDPSPRAVSLDDTLQTTLETYREQCPDVSFTFDCPPNTVVETIPEISLVFRNLIENAVRHNDAANPRVDITVRDTDDATVVTVQDNGPGIPEQELLSLARREETALIHGTGMGLWLVSWIIEKTEASLTYETGETGTEFSIEFPDEY